MTPQEALNVMVAMARSEALEGIEIEAEACLSELIANAEFMSESIDKLSEEVESLMLEIEDLEHEIDVLENAIENE